MTNLHILRNTEDVDPQGWLQTVSEQADRLMTAIMDNEFDSASAGDFADLVRATKHFHLALELFNERANRAG